MVFGTDKTKAYCPFISWPGRRPLKKVKCMKSECKFWDEDEEECSFLVMGKNLKEIKQSL